MYTRHFYVVFAIFFFVAVVIVRAQAFPDAGSSTSDNTIEDILQNQSQNKQSDQLQLSKDPSTQYSDSYVDPKTYFVGPFDVFNFTIWQPFNYTTLLTISPEGTLVVPRVGEFDAKGKTLDSLRLEVLAKLNQRINNNVQASLTLFKPRAILVNVSGYVKQPGEQLVRGNSRVSLAIQLANQTPKDQSEQPYNLEKKEMEKIKEKERRIFFGTQDDVEFSLREIVVKHNDGSDKQR